jgi:hypothetical protein
MWGWLTQRLLVAATTCVRLYYRTGGKAHGLTAYDRAGRTAGISSGVTWPFRTEPKDKSLRFAGLSCLDFSR